MVTADGLFVMADGVLSLCIYSAYLAGWEYCSMELLTPTTPFLIFLFYVDVTSSFERNDG